MQSAYEPLQRLPSLAPGTPTTASQLYTSLTAHGPGRFPTGPVVL